MSIIRPKNLIIDENTPRAEIDIFNLFKEKLSDDAKEMYHFDDADTSYKSLNVRVSVYEHIRRIAKKDNRTINATVALMVKETLKNRRKQSV